MTTDDMELVREYAARQSESAFATLVSRHTNLVYSAALRQLSDPQLAEEVTQVVFIILARKAGSLDTKTILPGWLYRTACYVAGSALKRELRRQHREQEAYMQSTLHETQSDSTWNQMSPMLDEAMLRLSQTDRDALVLRFFEGCSVREVGSALGASEEAAKKRLNRAMEKLRQFFTRRGIIVPAAVLIAAISANSVQAAPAALAKTATAVALAKGAAVSTSTLTLIKGALKLMAWTKAKIVITTGVAVLLAAGTTTVVVEKIAAAQSPSKIPKLSATDLSWADNPKYWETDSRVLGQLPAGIFIFRPTKFPNSGGGVWANGRMAVKNNSVGDLVGNAYGFSYTRTMFPPDMPGEHFDVMFTRPGGSSVSSGLIKNELQNRFGLTAHRETREADVLLLKVKDPNPPNLKPHDRNDRNSSWIGGVKEIKITNQELSGFFSNIESTLGQPVLDQTGLNGHYDLQLKWRPTPGESDKDAFRRALLEQLGLELVPSRESIEMLIVDKA